MVNRTKASRDGCTDRDSINGEAVNTALEINVLYEDVSPQCLIGPMWSPRSTRTSSK